jgi:hypothetical protein
MYASFSLATGRLALLAMCLAVALFAATPAAAQLLNPGFETDAVMGQEPVPSVTDWTVAGGGMSSTTSATLDPVRSGVGSLQLVGVGGFGVPVVYQPLPATPGETWDFQGYIRTEEALTAGTRALLKIVFHDANAVMDLQPGAVNIGMADVPEFPGIVPVPQFTSAAAPGQWQLFRVQGVVPANATEVRFFTILVDETPGTVYFDDLKAELVEAGVPGDFNNDQNVDATDLGLWRTAFGATAVGDADDDGDSDGRDFLIWQRNFDPAGFAAVPEPLSASLLAVGLASIAAVLRRRVS